MPSTTDPTRSPQNQQQQQQQQPDNNASTAPPQPQPEDPPRLPINTYHCRFCSHLLLATTRNLDALPRRKSNDTTANNGGQDGNATAQGATGGLDRAIILPLPVKRLKRKSLKSKDDEDDSEFDDVDNDDDDGNGDNNGHGEQVDNGNDKDDNNLQKPQIKHVTILLSTVLPNTTKSLIRRADGFEKRLFLRCGRCHVFVGYFLHAVHFADWSPRGSSHGGNSTTDDNTNNTADSSEPKVVYILPGALVETGLLADGNEGKLAAKDAEWKDWLQ